MSGGRGGDLWKARKHSPRDILLADLDGKALKTAEDRWSKRRNPRRDDPILRTMLADLCESHEFATRENTKFDVCSCMFAFHYFLKSSDTWSSILRTLKGAVKVDGYFFVSCKIPQLKRRGPFRSWRKQGELEPSFFLHSRIPLVFRHSV